MKIKGKTDDTADRIAESQSEDASAAFSRVNKNWIAQTLSWDEALSDTRRYDSHCEDRVVKLSEITALDDTLRVGAETYAMSNTALTQLGLQSRTTVPVSYWDKVPGSLRSAMLDFHLSELKTIKKSDDTVLLRTNTDSGTVRAFLSDRYSALSNTALLEILKKHLPLAKVSHWRYSGDTMDFNVLIPDLQRSDDASDYGGGVAMRNGETGITRLLSAPFLFRWICFNGCVWAKSEGVAVNRRHKGDLKLEVVEDLVMTNINAQIPLVSLGFDQLQAAKKRALKASPAAYIAAISKTVTTVSTEDGAAWIRGIAEEPGENAYALVNGLTRAAQYAKEIARATKLEALAGTILAMPAKRWASVESVAGSTPKETYAEMLES